MKMLKVEAVNKTFGFGKHIVRAVSDLTISVAAGEFVAIMGPSGCGKSTVLNLIAGIDRPNSGSIIINGRPITDFSEDALAVMRRRHVGFIYQFFSLLPDLTAAENIILPALIAGDAPEAWRPRLAELLELVNLRDRRDHFPSELSGGEQQRVAIARALVLRPSLLLADEPTGSLDTKQGSQVLDLIHRTVRCERQTVIMVTHDHKIAAGADRVIFMRDGRVVDEARADSAEPSIAKSLLERAQGMVDFDDRSV